MVDQSAVGREFTPVTARVEPGRLRYFLNTIYREMAHTDRMDSLRPPRVPNHTCLALSMAEALTQSLASPSVDS